MSETLGRDQNSQNDTDQRLELIGQEFTHFQMPEINGETEQFEQDLLSVEQDDNPNKEKPRLNSFRLRRLGKRIVRFEDALALEEWKQDFYEDQHRLATDKRETRKERRGLRKELRRQLDEGEISLADFHRSRKVTKNKVLYKVSPEQKRKEKELKKLAKRANLNK